MVLQSHFLNHRCGDRCRSSLFSKRHGRQCVVQLVAIHKRRDRFWWWHIMQRLGCLPVYYQRRARLSSDCSRLHVGPTTLCASICRLACPPPDHSFSFPQDSFLWGAPRRLWHKLLPPLGLLNISNFRRGHQYRHWWRPRPELPLHSRLYPLAIDRNVHATNHIDKRPRVPALQRLIRERGWVP